MLRTIVVGLALLAAGCSEPLTGPNAMPLTAHDGPMVNAQSNDENCTFDRGVNSCTTTAESTETVTRLVTSGCVAGPPPFQPGRATTTFEDTYVIRTTTTTQQHGRNGKVFSEESATERTLMSSRFVSRVCEKL